MRVLILTLIMHTFGFSGRQQQPGRALGRFENAPLRRPSSPRRTQVESNSLSADVAMSVCIDIRTEGPPPVPIAREARQEQAH